VLVAGDILVLDNASQHTAAKVTPTLDPVFSRRGIRVIYLPAYSPEYNPCEPVFAQVKRHMRQLRGDLNFTMELLHAFAAVERLNVFNYYRKCIEDVL
jgi:transposase